MDNKLSPYANFRYRLKYEGHYAAGFANMASLKVTTHLSGQTNYAPIQLKRGVSYDTSFEQWCNQVFTGGTSNSKDVTSLNDLRKNIVIEMYNEAGQIAKTYTIMNAWSSNYIGMDSLDNASNGVLFESLTLQNEGIKEQ